MTMPREVLPGCFYMVTRRCTQRQFLLRPDKHMNNAFIYCVALAAKRFGIDVILPVAMSNHYHIVIYDRLGALPQFTEHLNKLLAKCGNALRGRWENFWASEQVCVVRLVERDDVMRKLVYVATNPVKDDLVQRADQWPGVNGLTALLNQRPLRASRPTHFFRPDGKMPESLELTCVIPPELGDTEQVLRELRQRVATAEAEAAADRRRRSVRVLGRRAVKQQSWQDAPTTRAPRRNLRPVVAGSGWARVEALRRNRAFLDAYRQARESWKAGQPAPFPPGTYWLRRFANVEIAA